MCSGRPFHKLTPLTEMHMLLSLVHALDRIRFPHNSWVLFVFLFFVFQALGPEFIRMSDEQQVVLELPGSIVVSFFPDPPQNQFQCSQFSLSH